MSARKRAMCCGSTKSSAGCGRSLMVNLSAITMVARALADGAVSRSPSTCGTTRRAIYQRRYIY
eukprot:8302883-Pyramimonas_sp.AAC.1